MFETKLTSKVTVSLRDSRGKDVDPRARVEASVFQIGDNTASTLGARARANGPTQSCF